MSYDIIIKNGKIIDGAGNPWYHGEVGIKDGKIAKIGTRIVDDSDKVIDASGLVVCPGFIDVHSHTDYVLVLGSRYLRVESFIRQGITTTTIGMCGDGVAPIPPEKREEVEEHIQKMTGLSMKLNLSWNTYAEYMNKLEKDQCSINLACFVGYNNLRFAGAGSENRDPTIEELNQMKEYLSEAMEAGAFGMSTGLIYAPQIYAKTEELVELMNEKCKEYAS